MRHLLLSLALPLIAADLPEGPGLAAAFIGDANIANSPAVIFADDFESYRQPQGLTERWDSMHHLRSTSFVRESSQVFAGKQSLRFEIPKKEEGGQANALIKLLRPKHDRVFLRHCSPFDTRFAATGSSHNGCSISAGYYVNGRPTAGIPADGRNKFLVSLENSRFREQNLLAPGRYNIYIYHPLQRDRWGDHFYPTGTVLPNSSKLFDFGSDLVARPDVIPQLGRWYCHELMLQANSPGKKDGRVAFWLKGTLAGDFPNLHLRDLASLKIDRVSLTFHIGRNDRSTTSKYFDNVVIATEYIGPVGR